MILIKSKIFKELFYHRKNKNCRGNRFMLLPLQFCRTVCKIKYYFAEEDFFFWSATIFLMPAKVTGLMICSIRQASFSAMSWGTFRISERKTVSVLCLSRTEAAFFRPFSVSTIRPSGSIMI